MTFVWAGKPKSSLGLLFGDSHFTMGVGNRTCGKSEGRLYSPYFVEGDVSFHRARTWVSLIHVLGFPHTTAKGKGTVSV